MAAGFHNILIIKPSALGDIVMALPALTALREGLPHAKISWLIRPEFAALIENHPHLDEVIIFDRKLLGKAWQRPTAFSSLLSLIRRLRHGNFDAVVDLQGLFRTATLARLSGTNTRLGMANARELGHLFYTDRIAQDENCIHIVDYCLRIVEALGAPRTDARFIIPKDQAAADAVTNVLITGDVNPDNYAVFIPSSKHAWKCWPAERFTELAQRIAGRFHLSIVATGSACDKDILDKLTAAASVPIANLAGQTNLRQLIELLRTARLVVSNDTGPGHIAAALGTPLVMMFGPSNPARLAPYGRPECVIDPCPAGRGTEIDSADPKFAITNISIDDVFQKVVEQLRA